MTTTRINIDFRRSQQIGVPIGNHEVAIIREFADERSRDRVTVSLNGHEFTVARAVTSLDAKPSAQFQFAEPTGHADMRVISRRQSYNR